LQFRDILAAGTIGTSQTLVDIVATRLLPRILILSLFILLLLCPCTVLGQPEPYSNNPRLKQYIRRSVISKVARNWIPVRSTKISPIEVKFKMHKNGSVSGLEVCSRGIIPVSSEQKILSSVRKSTPFDPLPPTSTDPLEVKIKFETTTALRLTVAQAIKYYSPLARQSLRTKCAAVGISYPPKRLVLLGLKEERRLEVFGGAEQMKLIGSFPLVSYSGVLGPKLKQGDLQIPEGIYGVTGFQSRNMLALCVNYPNEFDKKNAAADHRDNLGGEILIHGGSQSTGCLVVSDDDMEEVFVAVYDVGCNNTKLIIAPCDLTKRDPVIDFKKQPRWLPQLYKSLKAEMVPCKSGMR
jgi:hypothetical protein